jgi:hypothetical protein
MAVNLLSRRGDDVYRMDQHRTHRDGQETEMLWQPSNTAHRLMPCREAAKNLTGRPSLVSGISYDQQESGRRRD